MAIKVERTKYNKVQEDSCAAAADLSALHQCLVRATGGASGNMTVSAPAGQGLVVYGVLLNAPTSGQTAELQTLGIAEIRAAAAINAGVEVTVADATGRIMTAASGDFVIGVSREAATGLNHCISVDLKIGYYMP